MLTIKVPKELPHQTPILLSPARFKVAACGRRWGKTALGLLAAIRGHGPIKGDLLGAAGGGEIWWVAPSHSVAAQIWRDLKNACRHTWVKKIENEHRIELPCGGAITVRSADTMHLLRGAGLDGLILDEAAFVEPNLWKDVLRPALADKQGWAIFISTPNGCNWFYRLFQQAERRDGWERWQRPTSDNPVIAAEELASAKLDMGPRAFAQEHLAEFTELAGAEFCSDYFYDEMWFDEWPSPDQLHLRVIALDPSKGKTEKSDYSAFVMLAYDKQGKLWVDAHLGRYDLWQMVDQGLLLADRFKPDAFGIESNQFQEVLTDIFRERSEVRGKLLPLFAMHNGEDKTARIRAHLTPFLARKQFRFRRNSPGASLLVEQLQTFPMNKHDDGPDALDLAIQLVIYLRNETPPKPESPGHQGQGRIFW